MAPTVKNFYRQAESYVERIFNGAQAGELPFQGPTHLDFVISMRTAKALGVSIPPSLLVGAEVIE
jgi:putative ABC transport system substrate-binding protein